MVTRPVLRRSVAHYHFAHSFVWDQGCVDLHSGPKVLNRKAGGCFLGLSRKGLGSASKGRSAISPGLVLARYIARVGYFAFTFHLWIKSGQVYEFVIIIQTQFAHVRFVSIQIERGPQITQTKLEYSRALNRC